MSATVKGFSVSSKYAIACSSPSSERRKSSRLRLGTNLPSRSNTLTGTVTNTLPYALSDVYAMGGRPLTAMNLLGVPTDVVPPKVINAILRGGAAKAKEAKCALVGGHTIRNPEPVYGLAVTGLVNPRRMITNTGVVGEVLRFLWARKMWWLIPMVSVLLLMGLLLIFASASGVAPFIYSLF